MAEEVINYKERLAVVENYKPEEYFKATAGTYQVVCLEEARDTVYSDGVNETDQLELLISVTGNGHNAKTLHWTIPKGKTNSSIYAQILKVAVLNNNQLTGAKFTLLVKNDGKKNDYTIVEVV